MTFLISVGLGIFCLVAASGPSKENKEHIRPLLILLGFGLLLLSLGLLIL